jgi:hypothetical protein
MQMPGTLDPITAEKRSRTASNASLESPAKFVAEGASDLRMLIGHCQTVSAGDIVEHVFETFRHSDLEFLAIVDGERLLGMCSRHAIDSLLGGRYGFSLWARKPIAEHVAANEIRIVVTSAITDVLREVFARNQQAAPKIKGPCSRAGWNIRPRALPASDATLRIFRWIPLIRPKLS